MNAPEAIAPLATITVELPLMQLHASPTNPRKHFDQAALAELANSIRAHGVLQPILARGKGEGYEIVAGERRWRAAKIAGLATMPVLIRELGDLETLEMQVVENLQRSDLHPLEEAEGYEQLMKLHKQSADDVAAKVGKSRAYVYARLKLLALSPEAREAFYAGALVPSTALLVARIPGQKLQAQALKDVTAARFNNEPMSVRQAADHIQRTYMLRLKEAPFDPKNAKLVAKIGSCAECPKRTGNQPELFSDVNSADVCTDPECFDAKREAHFAIVRVQAEAKGQRVIAGKEAKKIAPYGHGRVLRGHVHADDASAWVGNTQVNVGATLKKLPDLPLQLLEVPDSHELVPIVEEKALVAAMKKAGLLQPSARSSPAVDNDWMKRERAKKAKKQAAVALERSIRRRILDAVRGKLTASGKVTREDGVAVALNAWAHTNANEDDLLDLAVTYGWIDPPKPDAKRKPTPANVTKLGEDRIPTLDVAELWRVMLDVALIEDTNVDEWRQTPATQLLAAAERHGVDHAAIRDELTAAAKAKEAEVQAAAKAKAAKKNKSAKAAGSRRSTAR